MAESQMAVQWGRKRDKVINFEAVPNSGTGTAVGVIPRYARTLLRTILKLGGTTFTQAMVTAWRLKLGEKTISKGTGAHQIIINKFLGLYNEDSFITIDFTDHRDKQFDGEFVGGIDLSKLPPGKIYFEVDITGATSPILEALCVWGPSQPNDIIMRQLQYTGALSVISSVGGNNLQLQFPEASEVLRLFMIYGGTDWVGSSATGTAWSGNTGNGTMGAVTVSAAARRGTHKFVIAEPGANVGTFLHYQPNERNTGHELVSTRGVVASAYSGGGLAFTLADGATDFVTGDGFDVIVGATTQGNITRVEVKKDDTPIFDRQCLEARFEQREVELLPQSKLFVVDFTLDRNKEGRLITADTKALDINAYATATDTYTIYAQVLASASKLAA